MPVSSRTSRQKLATRRISVRRQNELKLELDAARDEVLLNGLNWAAEEVVRLRKLNVATVIRYRSAIAAINRSRPKGGNALETS